MNPQRFHGSGALSEMKSSNEVTLSGGPDSDRTGADGVTNVRRNVHLSIARYLAPLLLDSTRGDGAHMGIFMQPPFRRRDREA